MPFRPLIRTLTAQALNNLHQHVNEDHDATQQRALLHLKKDAITRLQERLSINRMGNDAIEQLSEAWQTQSIDFLHYMADGEMTSDYGFGFKARDYFMCMSEQDQSKFEAALKGQFKLVNVKLGNANVTMAMKSSTTIVWLLELFPLDMKKVEALNEIRKEKEDDKLPIEKIKRKNEINEARRKLEARNERNEDGYGEGEIEIRDEVQGLFGKDEAEITKWLDGQLKECILKDGTSEIENKVVAKFEVIGHEIRKYVAQLLNSNPDQKNENEEKAKNFGTVLKTFLEKVGEKHHLEFGATNNVKDQNEKARLEKQAAEIKLTIGQIGRAWGDSTAALGYHPWELKKIQTTFSAVGADWDAGKTIVEEKMNEFKKIKDQITWCDMYAPGAMWSQAANYDRYRNTEVYLFLKMKDDGSGGEISNPRGEDRLSMRVTFAELQLGRVHKVINLKKEVLNLDLKEQIDKKNIEPILDKKRFFVEIPGLKDSKDDAIVTVLNSEDNGSVNCSCEIFPEKIVRSLINMWQQMISAQS